MRKILTVTIIAFMAVLYGCSDNDSDKRLPGDTEVKFPVNNIVYYPAEVLAVELHINNTAVASVTPTGNGFTMTLPYPLSDNLLTITPGETYPDGVSVSNPNAKINKAYFAVKEKDVEGLGEFYLASNDKAPHLVIGNLLYSNDNCDVAGKYEEYPPNGGKLTYIYNYRLRKGWNLVYEKIVHYNQDTEYIHTTSPVGGLRWYFNRITLEQR